MCFNAAVIMYFRILFTRKERLRAERFYESDSEYSDADVDYYDEERRAIESEKYDAFQDGTMRDADEAKFLALSFEEKQRVVKDPSHPYHKYIPPERLRERSTSEQSFDEWVKGAIEKREGYKSGKGGGGRGGGGILKNKGERASREAVSLDRANLGHDSGGGGDGNYPSRDFRGAVGGEHHAMSMPRPGGGGAMQPGGSGDSSGGGGNGMDDSKSVMSSRSRKSNNVAFDMGSEEGGQHQHQHQHQQHRWRNDEDQDAVGFGPGGGDDGHRRGAGFEFDDLHHRDDDPTFRWSEQEGEVQQQGGRGGSFDDEKVVTAQRNLTLERKSSFDSTEGETESQGSYTPSQEYEDRMARRQRALDLCCDDVCGEFEWWSFAAWLGWAIRLFIEVSF
jgi:hypothetical protein